MGVMGGDCCVCWALYCLCLLFGVISRILQGKEE